MRSHHDESRGAPGAPLPFEVHLGRLAWLGGAISAGLIVLILLLTAVSVFCRYILGVPLLGGDEAAGFLVVATVMFGAAEALRRGDHIGIDILPGLLPERGQVWLAIFGHAAVLVFSGVLLASAWRAVSFSRRFEAYSTGALEMPLWIPQSTMLVGAVLLGLVALTRLLALLLRKAPA